MVKTKKPSSKKKPKGGIDFKKYKRKLGRKLPPPQNATNTEIKSKAIILPEQSLASDRSGLAVDKGLTLKELLQKTSHHNAKIRRAALAGVGDLLLKHPSELTLHKLAVIEKLRERICDNDKAVREKLYDILRTVIFHHLKEDITWPIISSIMAYVFNAMTHVAVDIRLMAFKFFELIVSSYPSSFVSDADKVLDNYVDILRNNQIYLQDKSKLKSALSGLFRCLSLLVSKKGEGDSSSRPNAVEKKCLHTFKSEEPKNHAGVSSAIRKIEDLMPLLVNFFRESISLFRLMPVIDVPSYDCMLWTLQCINMAVKIVVNEINMPQTSFRPFLPTPSNGPDVLRCTVLVLLRKLWETFPICQIDDSITKEDDKYFNMNLKIAEIFLHLSDRINDNAFPYEKFLKFILGDDSNLSSYKMLLQKRLCSVIPFIPRLMAQVPQGWKNRLLQAFTSAFKDCEVESEMLLLFLSAIEEMILPRREAMRSDGDLDMLNHQKAWLEELPSKLMKLDGKHPSVSKVILKLALQIGQSSQPNTLFDLEYDDLQQSLTEFYFPKKTMDSSPFMKLPKDCQELAICCLYYFSNLSGDMHQSLTSCCLYDNLEPDVLLRIVEVLDSAYRAGHVQVPDQIGFLLTLLARFKVYPENFFIDENEMKRSNRSTFKSLTSAACSCLNHMGDSFLVLKLVCKNILYWISMKLPLDNSRGLLKLILTLGTVDTVFSEDDISNLSNWICGYLLDVSSYTPGSVNMAIHSDQQHIIQYYVQPCIFLFQNEKVLCYVLKLLEDQLRQFADAKCVPETLKRVQAVASVLVLLLNDTRLHKSFSTVASRNSIKNILLSISNLLKSCDLSLEERHILQNDFDRVKAKASKLPVRDVSNIEKL